MQPIHTATRMFDPDQMYLAAVEYWDTPYTPLYGDVASRGIPFEMREPYGDGTFGTSTESFQQLLGDAAGASVASVWDNDTYSKLVVENGRLPNLIGYWAGGAPGYHAATAPRQVAYRFDLTLRSTAARGWFNPAATPALAIAMAGQGWVRVMQGTTTLFNERLTENGFVDPDAGGARWTAKLTTLSAGSQLTIYYVQDGEEWGGFVFKAVDLSDTTKYGSGAFVPETSLTNKQRKLLFRDAPVIGCGLFDDGTPPTVQTLGNVTEVTVRRDLEGASTATLTCALVNPDSHDGVGWEWSREDDPTGFLYLWEGTPTAKEVRRQRLVRVKVGFRHEDTAVQELYTIFTGYIDDFEGASKGVVSISLVGMEQRLIDQFVKNYPDNISYMSYDLRRLSGTAEPVYGVAAYDNWFMAYMLRDLLVRGGIDESRTRMPLTVPLANGTSVTVVM